jgi:uncharacterized membrane protein
MGSYTLRRSSFFSIALYSFLHAGFLFTAFASGLFGVPNKLLSPFGVNRNMLVFGERVSNILALVCVVLSLVFLYFLIEVIARSSRRLKEGTRLKQLLLACSRFSGHVLFDELYKREQAGVPVVGDLTSLELVAVRDGYIFFMKQLYLEIKKELNTIDPGRLDYTREVDRCLVKLRRIESLPSYSFSPEVMVRSERERDSFVHA